MLSISYSSHNTQEDFELEKRNEQIVSLDFPSDQYDILLFLQSHALLHNGSVTVHLHPQHNRWSLFPETVR
jgi:hypothetical protein